MTDIVQLDQDLTALLNKRIELSKLDYNDENYDELEEEIHLMEDAFQENYGSFLEDALHEVHDEYCPDSDVLMPIAYLPHRATLLDGTYKANFDQGIYVEVDDYASNETKLVLLPKPTRIVLQIGRDNQEIVWKAGS